MPHIPILRPEEASDDARVVYDDFHRRMSFPSPPNFIMTQGHSPAVARGTWGLVRNVLVLGEIPRWTKEMIFVAISNDRNCRYCTAAHIACCRMLGVDPKLLQDLVKNVEVIPDLYLRDIILFAVKCSHSPQSLTEEDFDKLRSHNLKQSQIVEIIGMSALAVYANIMADATAMSADEMFTTIGG
jgi:uncharacterized peroxidase-related enzyme